MGQMQPLLNDGKRKGRKRNEGKRKEGKRTLYRSGEESRFFIFWVIEVLKKPHSIFFNCSAIDRDNTFSSFDMWHVIWISRRFWRGRKAIKPLLIVELATFQIFLHASLGFTTNALTFLPYWRNLNWKLFNKFILFMGVIEVFSYIFMTVPFN